MVLAHLNYLDASPHSQSFLSGVTVFAWSQQSRYGSPFEAQVHIGAQNTT